MSSIVGKYLGPLFIQEVPAGTVNGTNVTFTIANAPASTPALKLFLDGVKVLNSDYTLSGTTITLSYAPTAGQKLEAEYLKA